MKCRTTVFIDILTSKARNRLSAGFSQLVLQSKHDPLHKCIRHTHNISIFIFFKEKAYIKSIFRFLTSPIFFFPLLPFHNFFITFSHSVSHKCLPLFLQSTIVTCTGRFKRLHHFSCLLNNIQQFLVFCQNTPSLVRIARISLERLPRCFISVVVSTHVDKTASARIELNGHTDIWRVKTCDADSLE